MNDWMSVLPTGTESQDGVILDLSSRIDSVSRRLAAPFGRALVMSGFPTSQHDESHMLPSV
jgi:hypothetical protein